MSEQLKGSEVSKGTLLSKLKYYEQQHNEIDGRVRRLVSENDDLRLNSAHQTRELSARQIEYLLSQSSLQRQIGDLRTAHDGSVKSFQQLESQLHSQRSEIENLTRSKSRLLDLGGTHCPFISSLPVHSPGRDRVENAPPAEVRIDWDFGGLPGDLTAMLSDIASSRAIPLEARVPNVCSVISKWSQSEHPRPG
jgi:hypothetical protein